MSVAPTAPPLAGIASLKVKLGLLVAVSVSVATLVATVGAAGGVPVWLSVPVTVVVALAVTQLLAVGMTAPLREMTAAARRMASGDYDVRIDVSSRDEVGELARAFTTMAADLAQVEQQRRELVANVSHELRTPLTGLCAVLENLVDGVTPQDPVQLRSALAQAERLTRLVEDLLEVARVGEVRAPLHRAAVPISDLLTTAAAETATWAREVRVVTEVEPPELVAHVDAARLRQLVANLLDNALRHSPTGGTVRLRARHEHGTLVLEVEDEGPGVAPTDRERVFERFGTLHSPEGGGGTGLGLAIARWVSDLHGGTIGFVDPPSGSGGLVRVTLPNNPQIAQPDTRPQPDTTPQPGTTALATPVPTATPAPLPPAPPGEDLLGTFWPDRGVPARRGLLLASAGVGVLGGAVLPFSALGLGTFLVLLAAGGVVLAASVHRDDLFTRAAAGLCVLLAGTVLVRDAEWIVVLCLLAGALLCAVGVTRGRTVPGFVTGALAWPLAGLRGLPWLGRTLTALTGLDRGVAVLRTVLWSVAALLVFGALFASGDAVVAAWLDAALPDLTLDTFVLRTFVATAVAGTVLAAAYLALNPPRVQREDESTRTAPRFEWLVPVLVVNAVFAAFLAAQATVVFGGHDYLRRTTGLTYADYVHQGFGQLTVATALMLVVVSAAGRRASRATAADRAWLRSALGLLGVQTLVVVASALYRMEVYQEAYGFTRLRLLVDVFEGWLGVVVLAVLASGITLRGAWLPRFALLSGVVALAGLALVNPDARVAEHNLTRLDETGRIDWAYLRDLSDDAVPVLADRPAQDQACALGGREPADDSWWEWNLGRSRAADLLPVAPGDCPQAAGD